MKVSERKYVYACMHACMYFYYYFYYIVMVLSINYSLAIIISPLLYLIQFDFTLNSYLFYYLY